MMKAKNLEPTHPKPIRTIVIFSVAIFVALTLGTHFPILADDYYWMNLPFSRPDLKLTDFYVFSRMPMSVLFCLTTLKLGIWESYPKLSLIFFFGVHSLAFGILFKAILSRWSLKENRKSIFAFVGVATLFALQPNNYEIHLWHLLSTHSLGALLIALSFRPLFEAKMPSAFALTGTVLGITAGLLTYDSFLFLTSGLLGLVLILSWGEKKEVFLSRLKVSILIGFLSIGLAVCVKATLGKMTGFLHVPAPETSFLVMLQNLKTVFKFMGLIHFYKVNWILTVVEWGAIGLLVFAIVHKNYLPKKIVSLLLALPFLAAIPLCIVSYSAQRAFYGPQLVKSLVLAFLLYILIQSSPKNQKKIWVTVCVLFALTYATEWELILKNKRQNYAVLEKERENLIVTMALCPNPCTLRLPPPGAGVKGDYVVPHFIWSDYYERIRLRNFPGKQIRYQIDEAP
jgi:hypothetical protein